ncbi:MAG: hypothetical protein Q4C70_02045 [Planctomycetia bacterium]|nr:hypothetical protein [Planctomycetia bacterium]
MNILPKNYRATFFALVMILVSAFCVLVGNDTAAQSSSAQRARKNAAKQLIEEMSETEEGTEFEMGFELEDEEDRENKNEKTSMKKSSSKNASKKDSASKGSASKNSTSKNSVKKGSSKSSTEKSSGKKGSSSKDTDDFEDFDNSEKPEKKNVSDKSSSKKKPKTSASRNRKKPNKEEEPEDTRTPEERERDRMAYYRETGIWRWPEVTDTMYEQEITRQEKYLEDIKAKFPRTIYYESEHFYYLTDAPKPIALECMKYLEAMYARLCEVFEFKKDARVWTGKCIVCAFAYQQDFLRFEQEFFSESAHQFTGATGLAHLSSDGNVLISLFYGDISKMENRWKFIGTLVHETTHGFLHRYRARQRIPLWVNEGIADFMVSVIVPADRQPALKQQSALKQMRQFGSVGGLMTTDGPLEAWQYGVASGLVGFMLKYDSHAFKTYLDDMKDGKEWTEALKEHYKCTPEELLFQFGRANRIPRLTY